MLLVGMIVSSLAVLISIFNMIMCAQNEFDPMKLETELIQRREKIRIQAEREQREKRMFVKQKTVATGPEERDRLKKQLSSLI